MSKPTFILIKDNKIKKAFKSKPFKYVLYIFIILLILSIPVIINYLYLYGYEYKIKINTAFSASDLLSIYGILVSGLVTVITVVVTLNRNHREYLQQIEFQMSQENRPFFLLDNVSLYSLSHKINIDNEDHEKIPLKSIELSRDRCLNNDVKIYIALKNVGKGMALSTSYSILRENGNEQIVSEVDNSCKEVAESLNENFYFIKLNVTKFFNNTTNIKELKYIDDSNIKHGVSPNTFMGKVEYDYLNISGVYYKQEIIFIFNITRNFELDFSIIPRTCQEFFYKK